MKQEKLQKTSENQPLTYTFPEFLSKVAFSQDFKFIADGFINLLKIPDNSSISTTLDKKNVAGNVNERLKFSTFQDQTLILLYWAGGGFSFYCVFMSHLGIPA